MRILRAVIVFAATLVLVSAAVAKTMKTMPKMPSHAFVLPDSMEWKDAPPGLPPGAMVAVLDGNPSAAGLFTMRAKMPDGYKIMPHWHPAMEHVTVLSGTLNLGMGSKFDESKGTALPAGSFAYMAPHMNHFAWTTGETVLQLHAMGPWKITYVNPADDPRKMKKE